MTEQELIGTILAGNKDLFKQLVEEHQLMVFRTCMGLLHDMNESEDISQDVFLEVYNSLSSFRSQSKLSTWIYRIAINKSLNHLKKLKRRKLIGKVEELFLPGNQRNALSEPASEPTDAALEQEERKKMVQLALGKLPENQQVAFVLFRYDELSHKEISEVMGLSVPAIESLIHRAKQGLQKNLLAYYKNKL
jgi:RNA polymerase sigma-70 factor, ECF subfamily